ncbi:MAG TPA: TIGR03790 family protein [Candidatus Dormibacteraeota bacterium]|nr:TIGR03790 family protein [Candidatus Dormibacteraeota bacterium]
MSSERVCFGGGSGLNVLVVVNQASSNSCEVGNYYCERRQVPPENVLRINWTGGNINWSSADFQTNLLNPVLAALSARQLSPQIQFVVLSMDIPFEISYGSGFNSTTSALFYGLKDDSGPDWLSVTNSYAAGEQVFSLNKPASAPGYSFLTTMITAPTVAQANQLIDQGVNSDGTAPYRPVLLAKTSDPSRNIRYRTFDNAMFNTKLCQNYIVTRTNCDSLWGQTNLLGVETGLYQFAVAPNSFVAGAMADSLTSYGGVIFGHNDQTSLMAFINAGAAGSYGTVTEPSPVPAKFPDPQNYFYQARGFSIAESYYQSLVEPFQGLLVAEPLAAPFRRSGSAKWLTFNTNALTGSQHFALRFSAADSAHPLQQVDLFLDGKFYRTITNVAPQPGDVLTVALNGYTTAYTVPANATLLSIATGVANALNAPAVSNITKCVAFSVGDRIELHSASVSVLSNSFFYADSLVTNWPNRFYRIVSLPPLAGPTVANLGLDPNGCFRLHAEYPLAGPYSIFASTNLVNWAPLATNSFGGPFDFVDLDSPHYPARFYRINGNVSDGRLQAVPLGRTASGSFKVRGQTGISSPYWLEATTNLVQWTPISTNFDGGPFDFEDLDAAISSRRFYRLAQAVPVPTSPQFSILNPLSASPQMVRVDSASQPYVLQISPDFVHWTSVFTNDSVNQIQTLVSSSSALGGTAAARVVASRKTFLTSPACGLLGLSVNGIINIGTWVQLQITKTNGVTVFIGATNQSFSGTVASLTQQLYDAVNASSITQKSDGLDAEDFAQGPYGANVFNLRTLCPGLDASMIRVRFTASPRVVIQPATAQTMTQNLSDLQPRNHLFITAGQQSLTSGFDLDTTSLPDGFHELTAVAYEGTHVRTQTKTTFPIRVANTAFSAALSLLDLGTNSPVSGIYHVHVTANTNNVSAIRLYSTGGLLGAVNNQNSATFVVNGSSLGVGLHQFYAVVDTTSGFSFRTVKQFARLTY